jgi:hypothetical protein
MLAAAPAGRLGSSLRTLARHMGGQAEGLPCTVPTGRTRDSVHASAVKGRQALWTGRFPVIVAAGVFEGISVVGGLPFYELRT